MSLQRAVACVLALVALFATVPLYAASEAAAAPPVIILKLDDLTDFAPELARWTAVADLLEGRRIAFSAGLICNSLEKPSPAFLAWIEARRRSGLTEIWFHGYDHRMWKEDGKDVREFAGPSIDRQQESFTRSARLAQERLGLAFATFGSPFNAYDDATVRVMADDPSIRIWLYGRPDLAKRLPRTLILPATGLSIEAPTFVPNPSKFADDYARLAVPGSVHVVQGHPGKWNAERFAAFTAIIDFLTAQQVVFMTPAAYADSRGALTR